MCRVGGGTWNTDLGKRGKKSRGESLLPGKEGWIQATWEDEGKDLKQEVKVTRDELCLACS